MPCCHTYRPQLIEHVRETTLRITHHNARWSSQMRTESITSQDYQTRKLITNEGNLSGPICTGHNQHTHTSNTRQPKPQLKCSSCSSAIPSHNSRDVIPSHNLENATCLTPIPSHNSKDMFWATTQGTPTSQPLRYLRSLIDYASQIKNQSIQYTLIDCLETHNSFILRLSLKPSPKHPSLPRLS